ncbi:acyl-CoA-binding domain-containing protein 4-like isoform X2 [Cornus florida]|uniref:acyl-CoA-binding domain-containing protein 4-like isoform X2 n=1 Tax=Cornus florida TaxID=4283 RepID=UPI0028A26BE9|nr:acyl-CoA-binding domain-containing protein 4-like isoform X2 [Cornus florida]
MKNCTLLVEVATVFDLINLEWCILKLQLEPNADKTKDSSSQEVLPPTSGHSMIYWAGKLLLLGGLSKNDSGSVTVRFIDLESHHYGVMETFGKIPVARSGQSVTMVGSRLIMFGGEDKTRQLLNDVHVLNLETMNWDVLETTQPPPSPRFDHTAAVHAERYLLIFGGCSHSIFFNDLHVLDLQTMEWSQPQIQGDLVASRAGHAGITIDDNWYIVGGGDNKNGAPETVKLNMHKLVLLVLTSVKERDALASEGLSVSSAVLNGEKLLVAFGGYNGNYNNEVFVMRPKPRDSSHPKIFQSAAAAATAASVTAAYAVNQPGKLDFIKTEDSDIKLVEDNGSQQDLSLDINAIREENKVLESLLAEVKAENSGLKEKIEETSSTHAELFKEFRSFKGQLGAERSRCTKLEAQITEFQKMLENLQSIEEEVQLLRRQKSELEREVELATAAQSQSSGGVWKWITGLQE